MCLSRFVCSSPEMCLSRFVPSPEMCLSRFVPSRFVPMCLSRFVPCPGSCREMCLPRNVPVPVRVLPAEKCACPGSCPAVRAAVRAGPGSCRSRFVPDPVRAAVRAATLDPVSWSFMASLRRTPICARNSHPPGAANVPPTNAESAEASADHRTHNERRRAMTWAQRLKRVFNIEVNSCRHCGGTLLIVASVEEPTAFRAIPARGHPCLAHFAKHGAREKAHYRPAPRAPLVVAA